MNNVVTLGKKEITELLQAYNKGVKSTFGLQKSRHQFAQSLGYTNWFELESQLADSTHQSLVPNIAACHHRMDDQCLTFEARFPDYKFAEGFIKFFHIRLQSVSQKKAPTWMDQDTLNRTFLEKLTEGYSEDELDMAPHFYEVMEWYQVEESMTEDNVFSFSFDYGSWSDELVKQLVDKVLKPAVERFLEISCIDGEFLSAKIIREYKYTVESNI